MVSQWSVNDNDHWLLISQLLDSSALQAFIDQKQILSRLAADRDMKNWGLFPPSSISLIEAITAHSKWCAVHRLDTVKLIMNRQTSKAYSDLTEEEHSVFSLMIVSVGKLKNSWLKQVPVSSTRDYSGIKWERSRWNFFQVKSSLYCHIHNHTCTVMWKIEWLIWKLSFLSLPDS